MIRFYTHKKHKINIRHQKRKKAPKVQKHNEEKHKNVNKQIKIKNALKKHLSGKNTHIFCFVLFVGIKS